MYETMYMTKPTTPGAKNLQKFESWINDRDAANDWADYIRGGKLNRTEVADECGFGTPAFRQNPSIAQALQDLEARLSESCVIKPVEAPTDEATSHAADMRILSSKAASKRHVLLPQMLTLAIDQSCLS